MRTQDMAAHTPTKNLNLHASRRNVVTIVIAVLFLYVLIPQVGSLRTSLPLLRHANHWWVIVGVLASLATYIPAALNYVLLAQKSIHYARTLVVQMAGAFINHLLPSGIGVLGVNYLYLRRERHTQTEAATVLFMNNALGIVGLALLLGVLFGIDPALYGGVHMPQIPHVLYWFVGVFVVIILAAALWFRKLWEKVRMTASHIWKSVRWYRTSLWRVFGALASSMMITVCFTLSLFASAEATGTHLSFVHALFILALSLIGATVAPTPGGLGGAEAGLFVGLVAYGTSSTHAVAVTLLYRLLTYWLTLGMGAVVTASIRGKVYF